jgi:pimeloyl-ACP methyl ester carboxylesterase
MQSSEDYARLESGIDICFDTFGDRSDPALLLIMGLSGPLTWWSPDLCALLASRGFFVIRYDNRDTGRSTKMRGQGGRRGDVVKTFIRSKTPAPYTMSDLAADAVGVLDHLEIEQAHVTGVSMGGMIAQTIAIEHPERVLSLVSIMSTTGRRSVGWQNPRLVPMLLSGNRTNRDRVIAQSVRTWGMIGSPGYPTAADDIRERAAETFDRGISMSGSIRQMQAVVSQPDRSRALQQLDVPVLVVHGLSDRMIHVSGGRATARAIPGAELLLIPGMGHDLPRQLWPSFADGIERTAKRANVESSH